MVMSIISSLFSFVLVITSAIGLGTSYDGVVSACWALMLLSGLGQAITTIISSGFACRAVCCRSSSGGRIVYVPRDNTQEIVGNTGNRMDGATALPGKQSSLDFKESVFDKND